MLIKKVNPTGKTVSVKFVLPAEVNAKKVCLCGEFNHWDKDINPMKKQKNGSFALELSLEVGRQYQFRYLLDGERWENDWEADAYCTNEFGSENSVLIIDPTSE